MRKHDICTARRGLFVATFHLCLGLPLRRVLRQVVHCPLSTFQRAVYDWVLQTGHVRRLLRGRQPCQCGSGALSARCCLKVTPLLVKSRSGWSEAEFTAGC